jgi:hypothetical protein
MRRAYPPTPASGEIEVRTPGSIPGGGCRVQTGGPTSTVGRGVWTTPRPAPTVKQVADDPLVRVGPIGRAYRMTNVSLALAKEIAAKIGGTRPVTRLALALGISAIVCLAGCQGYEGGDVPAASDSSTTRAPMVGQPGYTYPSRATTSWSKARTPPTVTRPPGEARTGRSPPPGSRADRPAPTALPATTPRPWPPTTPLPGDAGPM